LSDKGVAQAKKLAIRCKSIGFERIVSSDLSRAVQTAEILVSYAPCGLSADPAFREIDMGDVSASWDAYPDVYAQWVLHQEDIPYPNGENGRDVWSRCRISLEKLIALRHKKIAIVSHGGAIRSIVCGVLGIPQQKRFFLGAPLENCSISLIRYDEADKKFYLHAFNDFSHLLE